MSRKLISRIRMLFNQIQTVYGEGMVDIWDNPDGPTPGQVFEGLGHKGAEIILLARALREMVTSIAPGTLPEDAPMALNVDFNTGIVTVDPEPEGEPEPEGGN